MLAWAMTGCSCHCMLYLSLTMHLVPLHATCLPCLPRATTTSASKARPGCQTSWLVMTTLFLPSWADWWHALQWYLCLQEYRPEVWRVWSGSEWLEYDLARETAAVKAERLWSEAALQAQRRNNARFFPCQAMCCTATCNCPSSMPFLFVRQLLLGS